MYLHYAEHRVLQLYRMQTLLPLSHGGVDVHTRIRNAAIRFLEFWPYAHRSVLGKEKQTFKAHHPFCAPSHMVGRTLLIF